MWSGWSKPYNSTSILRTWALDSALISPSCISVGSPGARWITRNETKVMPIRSGTASTSRLSAYQSMGGYSTRRRRVSFGRVALHLLGHVPLPHVEPDAVRRLHDTLHATGHRRQRVGEIEEDDRQVLGQDFLHSIVILLPLVLVTGGAPLLEQVVHLRVLVGHGVEVVRPHLG